MVCNDEMLVFICWQSCSSLATRFAKSVSSLRKRESSYPLSLQPTAHKSVIAIQRVSSFFMVDSVSTVASPMRLFDKKKVWRCSFIYWEALVNLVSNKLYSTPVWYGVSTESAIYHTNTSDVSIRYPWYIWNLPDFSIRISETLSLINMSAIRGLHYKFRNLFLIEQEVGAKLFKGC